MTPARTAIDNRLLTAVAACDPDDVRAALRAGADPNTRNEMGLSALVGACLEGGERPQRGAELVRALVDGGADVNAVSVTSSTLRTTALIEAVRTGHRTLVAAVLEAGADPNGKAMDQSALMMAARHGFVQVMGDVMDAGGDWRWRNANGHDALIAAARAGQVRAVEDLVRRGADVNGVDHDGVPALVHAAAFGCSAVVDLLLQTGADASWTSADGSTVVDVAGNDATKGVLLAWRERRDLQSVLLRESGRAPGRRM